MALHEDPQESATPSAQSSSWTRAVQWAWGNQLRFMITFTVCNAILSAIVGSLLQGHMTASALLKGLTNGAISGFIASLLLWYGGSQKTPPSA